MRAILATTPLLLLIITVALHFNDSSRRKLDACYIRRELERPAPTLIPLGDGLLHNLSVLIMWTAMFLLALLPDLRTRAIYLLTYTSLWFHITYILLAVLKAPLYDYNCAGRHVHYPNGISGHYCYFIFVAMTARRFAQARYRANPNAPRILVAMVAVLMTLFGIGGFATLYRTFFHGYHSSRQIILGAALGILSHILLDIFQFREEAEPPVAISLGVLFASSLTSLTMYSLVWPHEAAGAAISQGHLMFHSTLWFILLVTAWLRVNTEVKVATE